MKKLLSVLLCVALLLGLAMPVLAVDDDYCCCDAPYCWYCEYLDECHMHCPFCGAEWCDRMCVEPPCSICGNYSCFRQPHYPQIQLSWGAPIRARRNRLGFPRVSPQTTFDGHEVGFRWYVDGQHTNNGLSLVLPNHMKPAPGRSLVLEIYVVAYNRAHPSHYITSSPVGVEFYQLSRWHYFRTGFLGGAFLPVGLSFLTLQIPILGIPIFLISLPISLIVALPSGLLAGVINALALGLYL